MNKPSGFRDLGPQQSYKKMYMIDKIKHYYTSIGCVPIITSHIDHAYAFNAVDSGDNKKLMFHIMKRGASLERAINDNDDMHDLSLRFDLTAPLMKYYLHNQSSLPNIFKVMQIGNVWRAERPQKGRFREFMQADIDIIGSNDISTEIELISTAIRVFQSLNIGDIKVRINNRAILQKIIKDMGSDINSDIHSDIQASNIFVIIDKLDKIGEQAVVDQLVEYVGNDAQSFFNAIMDAKCDDNTMDIIRYINDIFCDDICVYEPYLIRGMGYYTGTVFEITSDRLPNISICGGGRYNGSFGDSNLVGCGISIGVDRVCDVLDFESNNNMECLVVFYYEYDEFLHNIVKHGYQGKSVSLFQYPKNMKHQRNQLRNVGYQYYAEYRKDQIMQVNEL